MEKGKRTGVDFTEHDLKVVRTPSYKSFELQKGDSMSQRVKFTLIDGVTLVTGDYGNWVFCRPFEPSKDGRVSDGYWFEKLQIASTQEYRDYCPKTTQSLLKERLAETGEDDDSEDLINYYNLCLEYVEDEIEYLSVAREYPDWADYEYIVIGYETKAWLKIVFDAFEHMCQRIAEEEKVTV